MVHGSWFMGASLKIKRKFDKKSIQYYDNKKLLMVHGSGLRVHGLIMVHGSWFMVHGRFAQNSKKI